MRLEGYEIWRLIIKCSMSDFGLKAETFQCPFHKIHWWCLADATTACLKWSADEATRDIEEGSNRAWRGNEIGADSNNRGPEGISPS